MAERVSDKDEVNGSIPLPPTVVVERSPKATGAWFSSKGGHDGFHAHPQATK